MIELARTVFVASVVLSVIGASGLRAQTTDPGAVLQRLEALEALARSLEKQISELNALLRSVLPPSPIEEVVPFGVSITNASVKGAVNAGIAFIEFSDFQCPFCGRHAQGAYRDLQRQFVETGKIKYVFRHLPIEQIHPAALKAAEASECAREQGKFWEMHDRLFANQQALAVADLHTYARALNVDTVKFQECLDGGLMTWKVKADLAEAQRLGLTATPAFLIGELQSDGSVRIVRRIMGAQPFQIFQTALEAFLTSR